MIASAMLPPSRLVDSLPSEDPIPEREEPAARPASALLSWAIKLSLAIGLAAFGATQYLSHVVETGPRRQEARIGAFEPETTGSIGHAIDRVVVDPCTASGLRR